MYYLAIGRMISAGLSIPRNGRRNFMCVGYSLCVLADFTDPCWKKIHSTNGAFITTPSRINPCLCDYSPAPELIPYIVSQQARYIAQGISLCRQYWSYPEREEAYNAKRQFFFGQDMLVPRRSPARRRCGATGLLLSNYNTEESSETSGCRRASGDRAHGGVLQGDCWHEAWYSLDETPVYRCGTIIPGLVAGQLLI